MAKNDPEFGLLATLEFSRNIYRSTPRNALVFSLTNQSRQPVSVLKWYTPLEGFQSDLFDVRFRGKRVPYVGRLCKRAAPSAEDYVTIAPGRTVRRAVDFFGAYDVARRGIYNVQLRLRQLHAGPDTPAAMARRFAARKRAPLVPVRANTAIVELAQARKSKLEQFNALQKKKRKGGIRLAKRSRIVEFDTCSGTQRATLQAALSAAISLANAARDALRNQPSWARPDAPRYRMWFGDYSDSRYGDASDHFAKIANVLANEDVKLICDDGSTDYGYVYPWMAYHINLGRAFWSAPLTGTDSQAGTLIHETSHFWAVAGTWDHEYGQAACRTLAVNHPGDAVGNADTHEYFAENTPALSMDPPPGSAIRITDLWRSLPSGFSGAFDAALNGDGPFSGKCYFFKGGSYIRYDWGNDRADSGYPKNIASNWHNMPSGFTSGFDAAVNGQGPFRGKCYFFKGGSYVRYDWGADSADSGYPKPIAGHWPNMPAGFTSNFDAIINGGGPFAGKCYFFKGDNYVRYDWNADSADPGYPRNIAANWHALPAGFTGSYGDALEGGGSFSGKGYFFKGDFYVRYNWALDRAET